MTNSCHFIGNLGADPRIHTFDNGDKQATFSIGVSEKWKNKDGEKMERTDWINIVARGGLVKVIELYLTKGSKVYIEGKLRTRKYEKDGVTQYATEILANNLNMLSGATGNQSQEQDSFAQGDDLEDFVPF